MLIRSFVRQLLRLPSGIALLLGLGALSGGAARGDVPRDPQAGAAGPGDLVVRNGADGIAISEGGRGFELLRLSDTPEARALKQMLEGIALDRAVSHDLGVRISPTILAGGGGSGFSWAPAPTQAGSQAPAKPGPAAPVKAAPTGQPGTPAGTVTAPDKRG